MNIFSIFLCIWKVIDYERGFWSSHAKKSRKNKKICIYNKTCAEGTPGKRKLWSITTGTRVLYLRIAPKVTIFKYLWWHTQCIYGNNQLTTLQSFTSCCVVFTDLWMSLIIFSKNAPFVYTVYNALKICFSLKKNV